MLDDDELDVEEEPVLAPTDDADDSIMTLLLLKFQHAQQFRPNSRSSLVHPFEFRSVIKSNCFIQFNRVRAH